MRLISDTILEEVLQREPTFPEIFPSVGSFDLGNPSAFTGGQPFEHFKILREQAPISWTPLPRKSRGFWSLTRYDDVKATELSPEIYSSEHGSINMAQPPKHLRFPKELFPAAINNLINLDAPRHMELRIQQKDFFIPKFVATLTENVSSKIDQLLDDVEAQAQQNDDVDFVTYFTEQLPLYTLCEMLGVDEEDRPILYGGCIILRWLRKSRHHLGKPLKIIQHLFRAISKTSKKCSLMANASWQPAGLNRGRIY